MVRYWIEWTNCLTNDKHSTDLHETEAEAMKAVPTWQAYRESVKVYQTMEKTDDQVS